jgi:hypothetical protein
VQFPPSDVVEPKGAAFVLLVRRSKDASGGFDKQGEPKGAAFVLLVRRSKDASGAFDKQGEPKGAAFVPLSD